MPVRRMTDEEAERILGSGMIFIGLKRPPARMNAGSDVRSTHLKDGFAQGDLGSEHERGT